MANGIAISTNADVQVAISENGVNMNTQVYQFYKSILMCFEV